MVTSAKKRREFAEELVGLQAKVEPTLLKIDELKEKLRDICVETGDSFTEEIAGKGSVEVKKGREAECKGEEPRLNIQAFLALKPTAKERLAGDGLIAMTEIWSKASKPTVTVRL